MPGNEGACERFQDKQYIYNSTPDDLEMLEHELEA
jgi:hypothetical protein